MVLGYYGNSISPLSWVFKIIVYSPIYRNSICIEYETFKLKLNTILVVLIVYAEAERFQDFKPVASQLLLERALGLPLIVHHTIGNIQRTV